MVVIGHASGSNDLKSDMAKAITNVTIVNAILIFVMMGMAFINYGTQPPSNNYMMVVTHVSMFLAMLSVSISSLQQLSSS